MINCRMGSLLVTVVSLTLSWNVHGRAAVARPHLISASAVPIPASLPAGCTAARFREEIDLWARVIAIASYNYKSNQCPQLGWGWTGNYYGDACKCHSVAPGVSTRAAYLMNVLRIRMVCVDLATTFIRAISNVWEHNVIGLPLCPARHNTAEISGFAGIHGVLDPWNRGTDVYLMAPQVPFLLGTIDNTAGLPPIASTAYMHSNSCNSNGADQPLPPRAELVVRQSATYGSSTQRRTVSYETRAAFPASDSDRVYELEVLCQGTKNGVHHRLRQAGWNGAASLSGCIVSVESEAPPAAEPVIVIPTVENTRPARNHWIRLEGDPAQIEFRILANGNLVERQSLSRPFGTGGATVTEWGVFVPSGARLEITAIDQDAWRREGYDQAMWQSGPAGEPTNCAGWSCTRAQVVADGFFQLRLLRSQAGIEAPQPDDTQTASINGEPAPSTTPVVSDPFGILLNPAPVISATIDETDAPHLETKPLATEAPVSYDIESISSPRVIEPTEPSADFTPPTGQRETAPIMDVPSARGPDFETSFAE